MPTLAPRSLRSTRASASADRGSPSPRGESRRIGGWLFLTTLAVYTLSSSGHFRAIDEYATYYMTEGLATRASPALPAEKSFFGRRSADGSFHAPYGLLRPVLSTPWFAGGEVVRSLQAWTPAQSESISWTAVVFSNALLAAIGVWLVFRLALELGATASRAGYASLAFAFASPHWHYATTYFSEPLTSALLLGAALALLACSRRRAGVGAWILASLPLALVATERLTLAILFPVFALAAFGLASGTPARRLGRALTYCMLPALAVGAYLVWNHHRFGDPLVVGYPDAFEGARPPGSFEEPFLHGLYGLTFSFGKGLFVLSLPALVGACAIPILWRRVGLRGAWLVALPLVLVGFYSSYSYWEGGYSYGPRFLLPTLGFWILPIAFLSGTSAALRATFAATVAISGAFTALAVSVSFLECQAGHEYYLEGFRYNLGYNALTSTVEVARGYLFEALRGGLATEPEGRGFSSWLIALSKTGIRTASLAGIAVVLAALAVGGIVGCSRALRRVDRPRSGERHRSAAISHA